MKKFFLALLVFSVAVGSAFFFSCDSQMGNENSGIITFTFGASTARWTGGAPSSDVQGKLAHEIKLYRGDDYGTLYKTINVSPGVTSHTETGVPAGDMMITIDSKLNGYPFAHGETTTTIVAGQKISAPVNMDRLEHGIILSENSGSTYHFPVLSPAYVAGDLEARTVTVDNYAEDETGVLAVALTGNGSGNFTLSAASIASIVPDGNTTFTVTPKTGLGVGTYTATISVTGGNGIGASFTVSVTVGDTFNVYDTTTWNAAITAIKNGGDGQSYTINVTGDFSTAGVTANIFGAVTGLSVTITGNHTITLSGTGSLLYIGTNQTVTLKDTHLKGHSGNNTQLVCVFGGPFNMEGGSITGNNPANTGGGVHIVNGTFNMTGGTISGNKRASGGGVYVTGTSSTFTMTGGTISDNTASNNYGQGGSSNGGGVYLEMGTFTMSGGEIKNNTAPVNGIGGGVYISNSSTTFNMSGGTISGNTATNQGGGVRLMDGTFNMSGGIIGSGNTADLGGGVYLVGGTFNMTNGTISGNTANSQGGGVYVTLSYSTFDLKSLDLVKDNTANAATNPGKEVYVNSGTFKIDGNAPDTAIKDGTNYYWP
jgi:hypothetical protein